MKIFHELNIYDKKKRNNLLIIYLYNLSFVFLFILIIKIKVIFMRFFLFLFLGIFAGLYLSWPGILIPGNWKCFNEIIAKSADDQIYFKAAFEISLSYLIKAKNKKTSLKIIIVADACFR